MKENNTTINDTTLNIIRTATIARLDNHKRNTDEYEGNAYKAYEKANQATGQIASLLAEAIAIDDEGLAQEVSPEAHELLAEVKAQATHADMEADNAILERDLARTMWSNYQYYAAKYGNPDNNSTVQMDKIESMAKNATRWSEEAADMVKSAEQIVQILLDIANNK